LDPLRLFVIILAVVLLRRIENVMLKIFVGAVLIVAGTVILTAFLNF
jgi:uncharacterized membrane protein